MSLDKKLNELRKAKKMTLDELSEKSGVPASTLKKISAGITTNPNLDTVQAIAKALDCSLDDFDDSPKNEYNAFLFKEEKALIQKYRTLDDYGKSTIDLMLNREYERSNASNRKEEIAEELFPSSLPTLTAEDERELELIKQEMLAEKKGITSTASISAKDA
ncbi:MAG: helix-turn-helix domain-containing protein [Anaerotignum propionicum]|uniref:helix-turn-helix domain-containing protein n=1 Tax=Anaerotignum propionicum TaxID=28446 RepID=UPI002B203452|nr:helix-turn-helix domain-containing protein [Anaerotignum propionicum]MEA5056080.1 helix-turn-helix domain-containing protein [Anaerotignum propionicum]